MRDFLRLGFRTSTLSFPHSIGQRQSRGQTPYQWGGEIYAHSSKAKRVNTFWMIISIIPALFFSTYKFLENNPGWDIGLSTRHFPAQEPQWFWNTCLLTNPLVINNHLLPWHLHCRWRLDSPILHFTVSFAWRGRHVKCDQFWSMKQNHKPDKDF